MCYSGDVMQSTTIAPNSATSAPQGALAGSPAVPSTTVEAAEQDVLNLRAQLDAAEERAKAERLAYEKRLADELHAKALTIPGLLGVKTGNEAIAILRREFASPGAAMKHPSTKLSDQTLTQMRAMLSANPPATLEATARACGCGIATVSIYKRKWGLTQTAPKVRAQKRGGKKGHSQIPDAKRNHIKAALSKPGAVVSHIAKRFRISRQSAYAIRAAMQAPTTATGG